MLASRNANRSPRSRTESPATLLGKALVEAEGERLFFKIDYYDQSLSAHSRDPSDETVTKRVLTIMLSEEY
jgi:Protein of unknown function (DUF3768)